MQPGTIGRRPGIRVTGTELPDRTAESVLLEISQAGFVDTLMYTDAESLWLKYLLLQLLTGRSETCETENAVSIWQQCCWCKQAADSCRR